MELDVKFISTEIIKPSKPTPPHLKIHPLSRLDQLFSVIEYRTPLVLFYNAPPNTTTTTTNKLVNRLTNSLSQTLSLFYPLAGRLRVDGQAIDCNDEGTPLVVARAKSSLDNFLNATNRVGLVAKFLPNHVVVDPSFTTTGWVPFAVQVSIFDCGGVAIGSQVLHKSLDGISRAHFFKTWAAFSTGRHGNVMAPDFKAALTLFPPCRGPVDPSNRPKVLWPIDGPAHDYGCTVRAFGFSAHAIAGLQSKAKSEELPYPTRVEAVSAFIWKHLMAASTITVDSSTSSEKESNDDEHKRRSPSALIHSVDMRAHIRPPLPPTAFGKFTTHAIATLDTQRQGIPNLRELVATIRQALSKAKDIGSINMFLGDNGEEATRQHMQKVKKLKQDSNIKTYTFTSWSGIDVDFGIGMPIWAGVTGGKVSSWFKNFVILIRTPSYGIEAWLILDEQEMNILESDSDFLAVASPTSIAWDSSPKSSL